MAPIRILVVDDSVTIRAILEEVFAKTPEVTLLGEASDAKEAIDMIETMRPTVVTIDVAMPGVDGLALLDHVVNNTHSHAIMLSGRAEAKLQAAQRGALGFFDKGRVLRDPQRLIRMIRAAADGKVDPALAALKASADASA